jgi:hypothetical protein
MPGWRLRAIRWQTTCVGPALPATAAHLALLKQPPIPAGFTRAPLPVVRAGFRAINAGTGGPPRPRRWP